MKLTAANDKIRARNVTASECGALLGEHPYMTPAGIFDRIMTGASKDQSLPMLIGQAIEPVLLTIYRNTRLVRLRANARTFEHHRVRLCATPDAFALGKRELVEIKVSGSKWRWEHGLPADVEWQARAQMACTHRSRVTVVVLIGTTIREFRVDRHSGKERRLTQAVEAFWRDYIETGIRPTEKPKTLELKTT